MDTLAIQTLNKWFKLLIHIGAIKHIGICIPTLLILLFCGCSDVKKETMLDDHLDLGWSLPIANIPNAALKYKSQAIEAIQSKNFDSAAKLLTMALKAEPTMDIARFHLAQVFVQLNKPEDAIKQINLLLLSDLPGYLSKVKNDILLSSLLRSEFSTILELTLARLSDHWRNKIKQGLPTVYVWQKSEKVSLEPTEFFPKNTMRAGMYFPDTQRFLPIGHPNNHVFSIFIDVENQQVLNVNADATQDLFSQLVNMSWQVQPWLITNKSSAEINTPSEEQSVFHAVSFWFNNNKLFMKSVEEPEQYKKYPNTESNQYILRLIGEGSLISSSVEHAIMLTNNTLMLNQKPIKLGYGHDESQQQSIVELDNKIFVISNHFGCNYDDLQNPAVPYQHHVLDYVNKKTLEVYRVSQGNGAASIQSFNKEHLALQRGSQLDLLLYGKPSSMKRLPRGLMLHAPLRKKNCVYN